MRPQQPADWKAEEKEPRDTEEQPNATGSDVV
jgi:hypothetical protein